jgi:two-component system cell cycle sensor histidine kinase/response regulator CckA
LSRLSRIGPEDFVRAHVWVLALVLGIPCLMAGLWGYYAEDAVYQTGPEAVAYFWLPLLMLATVMVSLIWRPSVLLLTVVLLDVEAALLGVGSSLALPFIVAVPIIGVAVALPLVSESRMRIPYIAALAGSSAGVAIATLRSLDLKDPSGIVVIPAFVFIYAIALGMLWRLDSGRLSAIKAAAGAESSVRDLLDGVNLLAVNVDRNSRIDFINEFALQVSGWRREEVLGADWWDTFATPDRREAARANYGDILLGRQVMEQQRESAIQTKAGDVRLIRWSHVTRHDDSGRVVGIASLGEDITTARAAEELLRRGAELLSKLVVSSPLATVVIGLDLKVQLWNPAAAELLGWSEAEVVGHPVPPVFTKSEYWAMARSFVMALRGQPVDHRVLELSRRDGQIVRVRVYGGALRDRDDKPMAVALQAIDVTSAVALEDQLREAQKMEAVGRLAGGVAHDFNNSLTAIGGFASLIASGSQEPETREAAQTILGAAKRAADLTRELLAYSRRSLLQPQIVDVNKLVSSVRPMLLPLLGEDVSVVLESHVSKAVVRVDPTGLERVILNLAANARDAMQEGGTLTIATDRRLSQESGDGATERWVSISVSDTGMGIPTELHSKVFDPFFTTKPVGSGTGLGLSMVKGFVVQSGGTVELHSEPGMGTTIAILLPEVAGLGEPEQAAAAGPSVAGGGETILVVEDEPAVAAVSFQVLSRSGYRVLLADSGASAIGLLRAHTGPIALLLLDVILPDLRGPVVAEVARTVHPESAVLFASGYSTEVIGQRGELPANLDLIPKPYAPEELLVRVREAIDRGAGAVLSRSDRPG